MTYEEKALILLEQMDKTFQVNWGNEKLYVEAFVRGLKEIEEIEENNKKD